MAGRKRTRADTKADEKAQKEAAAARAEANRNQQEPHPPNPVLAPAPAPAPDVTPAPATAEGVENSQPTETQINRPFSNLLGGLLPTGAQERAIALSDLIRDAASDSPIFASVERREMVDNETGERVGNFSLKHLYAREGIKFPGHVIEAAEHYQHTDSYSKFPNSAIRIFENEIPVMRKLRPMVILWNTAGGHFCIPMYTYGGRGLFGMEPESQWEHISIMPADISWVIEKDVYDGPIRWTPLPGQGAAQLSHLRVAKPVFVGKDEYSKILGHVDAEAYDKLTVAFFSHSWDRSLEVYKELWGEDLEAIEAAGVREPGYKMTDMAKSLYPKKWIDRKEGYSRIQVDKKRRADADPNRQKPRRGA